MSQFPFRFGSYARLSTLVFALSLLALLVVERAPQCPVPAQQPLAATVDSQLEEKAERLLVSLLGKGEFELHLSVETEQQCKEVKELTPTCSFLESEQTKRESAQKNAQASARKSEVSSRNWVVGKRVVKKKESLTGVVGLRCVVLVNSQRNVEQAQKALACLLGIDEKRGDQLLFIQK